MSQHDAMQAIDRAKAAIEDVEELVSELEDEDAQVSLSRDQLEYRIQAIQDQARSLRDATIDDLGSAVEDIVAELQELYNDV